MSLFSKFDSRKQLHLVITQMNSGDFLGAMNTCERLLQKAPRQAEAARLMGQICEKLGNDRKAIGFYKTAAEVSPIYANLRAYGHMCRKLGEPKEAIAAFEAALERNQDSFEVMTALAELYEEKGIWPRAVGLRKAISDHKPGDSDALFNLCQCAWRARLMDEAVLMLTGLLKHDPLHSRGLRLLAECMLSRGQRERALELFDRSLKVQPDDWEGHLKLAGLCEEIGDPIKAVEHFQFCLRFNHSHPAAHRRLIHLFRQEKRWLEAQVVIRHLITTQGESPELLVELGDISLEQKDYDEASTAYQQARLLGQARPEIDGKYIQASIHCGRAHEVVDLAASLLSRDVFNVHFRFLYALCQVALGQKDLALQSVREAPVSLDQHPEFARLRAKLMSEAAPTMGSIP